MMKAILSALAIATATTALPASAGAFERNGPVTIVRDWGGDRSGYGGRHRMAFLPEHRVERIVYREGFVEIADLRLRRDVYIVEAIRPNGAVFRLALDARDGSLLRSERVGWARGGDRPVRQGIEFRFGF